MELLDRYLQAVRFWLPKAQQEDIIAKLSEDLRSQIEEKETALGRKLTEAELEVILKQRGRPVLVANRYQPQQSLIGPVLFPIYRFVLKVVALCYLAPWVLVWIGLMSFSASYRAEHIAAGWFGAIVAGWGALWFTTFVALSTVTLVFAILERVQAKSRFLEDWNPRKLPAVRNPTLISRTGSVVEVVVNLAGVAWWIDIMSRPVILDRPEIRITLAPVWRYFFWSLLVLALIHTVLAAVNLARPYWTVVRASVRLATDCAGVALFCWMLKVGAIAEIAGASIPAARTVEITNLVNQELARAFPVALAAGVAIALADLYRIYRVGTNKTQLTRAVAAALV
jgi:hypothetical protein